MFHVFRGVTLVLGPVAGYFIGQTKEAAFVGLGVAALVIAAQLVIERIPLDVLVFGVIGAFGGLLLAKGIDWLVFRLDNPTYYRFVSGNSGIINLLLACFGCMVAIQKKSELDLLDRNVVVKNTKTKDAKVIDTSVLIDGRIADIAETGFLSGRLIVPRFVLHELQSIADSADGAKRQKGRRGLDILKRLQDNHEVVVKIYDKDFPNTKEVDLKILELAKELDGKVATTDFNLSKVAVLQGISVLNVNDLASALKPVVLPGDALNIYLAKEGKEKAQAIGYLDDGTMVVVDDSRRSIGKRIPVIVSSILQTPAGRMIFARPNDSHGSHAPAPQEEKPGQAGTDSHLSQA